MADEVRDEIVRQASKLQRQLEEKLKAIPDNLSDDEAVRLIVRYCTVLGFEGSVEEARRIVREARGQ
jgi:hypothetical protein